MGLSDTIKDLKALTVGIDNIDLIKKLMDVQIQAYEILDENRELRLKLERFERSEEMASDLVYLPDFYYKKSDGSGPYCPICWDTKKLLVNVPIMKSYPADRWVGNCRHCGSGRLKVPDSKIPNT